MFQTFGFAGIKRSFPFLNFLAVSTAACFACAAPAVAQTQTQNGMSAFAAVRMSQYSSTYGLTSHTEINNLSGDGAWRKSAYAEEAECWSNYSTQYSSFEGGTYGVVRNDTSNAISIPGAPHPSADVFAYGSLYSFGQYETHHADSTIGLGSASAQGSADFPGSSTDYGADDFAFFFRTSYQPGDKEEATGGCGGHTQSTFPFVLISGLGVIKGNPR